MNRTEAFEKIKENMQEMFEIDPALVTLESRLVEDLGLDSIDAIDMAAKLEEFTGQRLKEDDLRKIRTVGDVVDIVHLRARANTEGPK